MCNPNAGPREQQLKKNWDAKNPDTPFPISPTNNQEPNKKTQTKSAPVEQSLRSTTTMNKNTTKKKPINKGSKTGSTLLTGTSDYL